MRKWLRDHRRVKTPTVLQIEAVECGAAALGIVLSYYGRIVPLEELRLACGVSRDGSKASNMVRAAREYGLKSKGFKKEPEELKSIKLPMIVFWNFNHFVVVEGFGKDIVYLNDPAAGPRTVSSEEFDQSFTGVVLTFEKTPEFKKWGKKPSLLGALFKRLEGSKPAVIFLFLVSMMLVIPGLIIPTFSRIFIDYYLVRNMDYWVKPLLFGMALTMILRTALSVLQHYFLLRLETKIALSSSSKFFWHILHLPIEFFTQRFSGEISSRVAINDTVAQILSGQLASTVLNMMMVFFYVLLMLQYDVFLTFLGVSVALLNILALKYISRKRVDGNRRLLQEQGKLTGTTIGGLQSIETLKASGREFDFFSRWAGYQAKSVNIQQELGRYSLFLTTLSPLLTTLNNALILGFGAHRVMEGFLTMGMLVAFQSLMSSFITPFNSLVELGSTLQKAEGQMNRLDDVLQYPSLSHLSDFKEREISKIKSTKLSGHLELKDLSFGYSRLESPLIEKFSLTLNPGDRVALIGATGSGKSTIAKLVSNLYQSWEGRILLDEKIIGEIPRLVLNNSLALVDQDIFLFEGTIRENLTMWHPGISEERLLQAAKDACIHDEIMDRMLGYDSLIEEGGRNFSGGQCQRLEIARALVGNPTILILDEAMSNLDPVTEKRIDNNLRRRGCTCLIIAHRLSTIRDCDEIIVLDRGKVVQRGTHEEMSQEENRPYTKLIMATA